jgi:hypothetical protein
MPPPTPPLTSLRAPAGPTPTDASSRCAMQLPAGPDILFSLDPVRLLFALGFGRPRLFYPRPDAEALRGRDVPPARRRGLERRLNRQRRPSHPPDRLMICWTRIRVFRASWAGHLRARHRYHHGPCRSHARRCGSERSWHSVKDEWSERCSEHTMMSMRESGRDLEKCRHEKKDESSCFASSSALPALRRA